MKNTPIYIRYARDVVSSDYVAGHLTKLSCRRFLDDLDRKDLIYRADKVDFCLKFIEILHHFKGLSAGQPFKLQPWQQFIVANIVGFYRKNGERRYTSSYIEVARKNGKTALASALCLYFLLADGEAGAEVDLCANSKEQAKIAFEFCSQFCRQLDPKQKEIVAYRDRVNVDATASKMHVFSADDSKLDGFNASFALIDEYHSAKNSKVRDVVKSSMGMRANPHLMTITTAGFDKTAPCYALRTTACEILNGIKSDDSFFAIIYAMDEDDDWTGPKNWIKANPNLGVTIQEKYLTEQVQSAKNNPQEEVGVKTKNLNVWCDSANVWIPDDYLIKCAKDVTLADFRGKECFVGVDLSSTSDLTAVSAMVRGDDDTTYVYKVWYYLPKSCLTDKYNKELYRIWAHKGYLTITDGNVVDYDFITRDLLYLNKVTQLHAVAYDKWNATQWALQSTEQGLPLVEYSQAIGNFNKPTKELERLILSGKVRIDSNPITRWCFSNVVIKQDWNENEKPTKSVNQNKIDGVIAMIQSLGAYLDYYSY